MTLDRSYHLEGYQNCEEPAAVEDFLGSYRVLLWMRALHVTLCVVGIQVLWRYFYLSYLPFPDKKFVSCSFSKAIYRFATRCKISDGDTDNSCPLNVKGRHTINKGISIHEKINNTDWACMLQERKPVVCKIN